MVVITINLVSEWRCEALKRLLRFASDVIGGKNRTSGKRSLAK